MSVCTYFVLCAVVLSISCVYAESDESGSSEEFDMLRGECLKELELTDEDLEAVAKTGDVSKINPCYWGCRFKKIGLLNEKGQYDLDNYLTTMRTFFKDDDFTGMEELARRCAQVKDKAVSDGEAGCERGALLAACFLKRDNQEFFENYL